MKKLLFVVLVLLFCVTLVMAQEPIYDHFTYLPLVVGGSTPTPRPTPRGWDCSYNRYNCCDFSSQAEAQACYEYCLALGCGDIHDLDRDSDGVACEVYDYSTATPTVTPTETPTFTATPTLTVTATITVALAATPTPTP